MTAYRQRQRAGRPVLGAHVANTEAARLLAVLLQEGFLKAHIARWLGHRSRVLHWRPGARVTWRTTLRLRLLVRRVSQ